MNIYFIAFGCKVSQYETECMKEHFIKEGFAVSSDEENADVFIINTCTVTAVSDKKCRQTLRRIRKNHPGSVIAVTGCFPQAFPDKISDIKEADIITGTKNRSEITELVKKALNEKKQLVEIEPFMNHEAMEISSCSSFTGKTRAFVKIQDGCNQF
ncbi:MAG TPA: tRNA (N(6)-L-threonylcarbamoyladenosine(37)-C(2))-methylthiotransferase MtaB, partial [Ruminococcus sp.]|nr:tRNA (N(6)-L-threonylcarbamoyladenosine(37)-C(2))-methylthiotransferase MtaB [Ruminococcus sp.]